MAGITDRSRELRVNATEAEKLLWSRLKQDQLGTKFRRQHPVDPYIVDFYAPEYGLVVEADGGQHNGNPADEARTAYLEKKGYTVIRFWNSDILSNIDGVLTAILEKIGSMPKKARPPRSPLPQAGGGRRSARTPINPPPPIHGRGGKGGRADFPVLGQTMNGRRLAYLDSASSAQKPQVVIDALSKALDEQYANIHRGLYEYSQTKTRQFEDVREKVARFIQAPSSNEIVFTRNATEAINLVAQSWGRTFLEAGDEVLLTGMEHHANIVPWHMLREEIGIHVKFAPVRDDGTLDLQGFEKLLSPRTRLVGCVHISNAFGVINDVISINALSKEFNPEIKVLIDGSQSIVHSVINIADLGCDFLVFTGHKLYGPTGIGVLWGRESLLAAMPPYQGGGDMIETVTFEGVTFKPPPARFEAGTPAIAEAIALGAAIDYVGAVGMDSIQAREAGLLAYAMRKLRAVPGLKFYGDVEDKAGIVSFTADWGHPSDIASILDQCGVAVRAGHHCCQPLMQRFGIDATVRASLGLYSDESDIDQFVEGLLKARDMLS